MTEKRYEVTLTTLDPFRIGGKEDPLSGADNPVAVVGGQVVIPGSSLKGALRSDIERALILRYYDQNARRWPQDKMALQPCMGGSGASQYELRLVQEGKYRSGPCRYPGQQGSTICPACYLLGAQGLVGFVRVPFLTTSVSPNDLYSARIDRARGVVVDKTNRSYQLIGAGAEFKGVMHVLAEDIVLGWRLGKPRAPADAWLGQDKKWSEDAILGDLLLERLQSVRLLGGYRSKGFGGVSIAVKPLE